MPDFEKLARPCLRSLQPYIPGKPIEEIQQRFGLARVIKLASNENPLGPSRRALEAVSAALGDVNRYPEGGSTRLRQAIAASLGLEPARILVGSGSDEIIELIARAFLDKGDELVASEHAFIRYKMAGNLMEARAVETPMCDYRHDLRAMLAAVTPRTKIVFIANPNNPTGTYVTRDEMEQFLRGIPKNVLVVMDEAYFEYARSLSDYPDSVQYLRQGHSAIVTLRTFSKIYGLAGLRVGYAIADPAVIREIDKIRPPFNVTLLSQAGCEAALADASHVEHSARTLRENLGWLCAELRRRAIEYVPSATNFLLIRTKTGGEKVFQRLLERGVIVRPMAEYGFPGHVRVTIGTEEETREFLTKFLEVDALSA